MTTQEVGTAEPVSENGRDPRPPESQDGRRAPSRRALLVGGLVVVLVAAGVGGYFVVRASGSAAGEAPAAKTSTATVARTDLVETVSYDGTLAYNGVRELQARSQGTVTAVPSAGATLTQGRALYRIDEQPAVLLYGALPMYRTLRSGVTNGADVKQLETALHALGYDPDGMTIDTAFTAKTTDAVNAWKAALGQPQDGTVTTAQVMFSPAPLRVDSVAVLTGQQVQSGATIATLTSADRVVTVALKTTDAAIAHTGDAVTVQLPAGTAVRGHISAIGTAASTSSSSNGNASAGGATNSPSASSGTAASTVTVSIRLDNQKAAGTVSQSPVTVVFTQQRAATVLAVPVTALLALAGGGYAVEVADGGGATHLVAVKPGLYAANGLVEVSGSGIDEGTRVVVPAS